MPEAVHLGSGKVRELYALDDGRLLLVATDRISTFDVVLPTPIPDKGKVLTGLSAFWFARTRHLVANHLLAVGEDGRSLECRRLEMLPGGGRRPRLPGRIRVARLPGDGHGVRARAAGRARGVQPAARADRHAGHEGLRGSRPQHRRGRRGRALPARDVRRRARGRARRVPLCRGARGGARDRRRRHEVRARASTRTAS